MKTQLLKILRTESDKRYYLVEPLDIQIRYKQDGQLVSYLLHLSSKEMADMELRRLKREYILSRVEEYRIELYQDIFNDF